MLSYTFKVLACHDYYRKSWGMSQCTTKAPRKFAWAEKPRYCKMILRLWSSSIVEVAAFYFSVHWLSRLRFPPNILWCAWISKLKQPFVDEITTPVKVVSFTTSMSRPFDVCYYFLWPELQAALVMWFCWAKMLLLAQRSRWLVSSSNKPRLATTKSSNAAIKNARKGRGFTLNHHYPRFLNRKIANLRGFMAMLYSSTCLLCHMPEIVLGPVLPYKALKSFLP